MYGNETNPIDGARHHEPDHLDVMCWDHPSLKQVTRLRLVTEPGHQFWDVSYCWGVTRHGTKVRVALPFDQLPRHGMYKAILDAAKIDGVFAKGLGISGAISACFVAGKLW